MAQQTDADATDEQTTNNLTPEDLIGKRIYNKEAYYGKGVVVDVKTISNLRGDSRTVFVCDYGEAADEKEHHDRFVNRKVEKVVDEIESDAVATTAYEIGDVFDDASPEDYDL